MGAEFPQINIDMCLNCWLNHIEASVSQLLAQSHGAKCLTIAGSITWSQVSHNCWLNHIESGVSQLLAQSRGAKCLTTAGSVTGSQAPSVVFAAYTAFSEYACVNPASSQHCEYYYTSEQNKLFYLFIFQISHMNIA